MEQLTLAREIAINLGGSITDNDVGFIACFQVDKTAQDYENQVNDDYDELAAQAQENCVVVVTVASLI